MARMGVIELAPITISRRDMVRSRIFAMFRQGGVDLDKLMQQEGFEWVQRSLDKALNLNKPELAGVYLDD